jgi:hypothetical protein
MNRKKSQTDSISKPILADAVNLHLANLSAVMPKPAGAPSLAPSNMKAAELDQDPGGRYNPSHTDPQV